MSQLPLRRPDLPASSVMLICEVDAKDVAAIAKDCSNAEPERTRGVLLDAGEVFGYPEFVVSIFEYSL